MNEKTENNRLEQDKIQDNTSIEKSKKQAELVSSEEKSHTNDKKSIELSNTPSTDLKTQSIDNTIEMLQKIDKFIDYIINSEYAKNFEEKVYDKNGVETGEKVINRSNIIANVLLGNRLGLTPMESIVQGKRLNRQGYQKIQLGIKLGLDPVAALDSMHVITTSQGETVQPGVHVLSKVLLENNIDFEFTTSYGYDKVYIDASNNKYEHRKINNNKDFYIVNKKMSAVTDDDIKNIKENKAENQTTVFFFGYTRYSEIIVRRQPFKDYVASYSLIDATNAGLYPGVDAAGNEVKGKSVWVKNTADMLESKLIRLAARRRAADKLGGNPAYGEEEIAD